MNGITDVPMNEEMSTARNESTTATCPACGVIGYPHDAYCPLCGHALVRGCGSCGAPVEHPIAYYCTACGLLLNDGRSGGDPVRESHADATGAAINGRNLQEKAE